MRRAALAPGFAFVLMLGCASAVRTVTEPALADHREALGRIAVAPLRPGTSLREDPARARAAAALVGRYLAEAMAERGIEVVAPSEVSRALGLEGREEPLDPHETSRRASTKLGAHGVLLGEVGRFRGRLGQAIGSSQPASVSFAVTLYAAPEGQPLWRAGFDETQRPLFDDLANFFRYPGRGTRWLSAEEMARWGAEEVVDALPVGP
jgi:hypothetical protein